jgi:hypothetical protein
MGFDHFAAGTVIDGGPQILHQLSVEPNVQSLYTMADRQDGLVETKGFLEEQFIHGCAAWVCITASRLAIFAISLWVNVKSAAWQQDPLHPGKQARNALRPFMQRHNDGSSSG